ncbi:hypothetical protein [uncultured Paludibaculum sp.]|uniref:hypothetical protein n=1 Tax=uncultured Paludibaculum sp. TaxID=1765020 RepID=UPI002AAA97DA|nr:hypothetical protein [uncultured Paludibaculum sp.]
MNIKLTTSLLCAALLTAPFTFAQGKGTPASPGQRANPGLNMAMQQTIEGTISSVQITYGVQYPSIVLDQTSIKVAPIWYLLENDFELAAGEAVGVLAAPSSTAGDPYLYAVAVTKTASGAKITLRNEAGVPLWLGTARSGGNAAVPRIAGNCIDPASINTVSGTIESVTIGIGIQQPVLVLKTNGTLMAFKLGPERLLLDIDLELKTGSELTVRYATATCCDEYLALQLTDATGNTTVLRNDDGTPAWNN